MKSCLTNPPTKAWILLIVPAVAIVYPVACVVVTAVIRAVAPEVERNVLSVI